ncbi:MAG: ABC transporter permease, partial [Chloroflexota bacterium]
MGRFVVRRILGSIPLLFLVAVLSFVVMRLAPGGPEAAYARVPGMTAEQLAIIRGRLGLDEPIPVQLLRWLGTRARGDLGASYRDSRPVSQTLLEALPYTLLLLAAGLSLALALAFVVGVAAARKPHGACDNATTILGHIGLAMPVFWIGFMLQRLFAVHLGWLPVAGVSDLRNPGPWDLPAHLVLPAVTIAAGAVAGWSRYLRASLLEHLRHDHVRTAQAMGLSGSRVLRGHVLRNALGPFVAVVAMDVPLYLTGAVLVETVFMWPGMGQVFFNAVGGRDYPELMGCVLLAAALTIAGNLVADIICGLLDPR